jgi:hypothetical protein
MARHNEAALAENFLEREQPRGEIHHPQSRRGFRLLPKTRVVSQAKLFSSQAKFVASQAKHLGAVVSSQSPDGLSRRPKASGPQVGPKLISA